MERLMEDAVHIHNLLPWIESDEDIINFMRKIPLDKSHLRNQLTLNYFFNEKDSNEDGFEKDIEDDAREIVVVMPATSYKEVKERLTILGNMHNRKEVVLRQLLHKKPDLDRIVREIDSSCTNKKRKTDLPNEVFDLSSSSNETNIKIKIRKVEGALEVMSSIKEKSSPLKAGPLSVQCSSKPPSSATASFTSSISHSETSTPDSTVSTPIVETEDSSDFMEHVDECTEPFQPSSSGAVKPPGCRQKWRESTSRHNTDNNYVIIPLSDSKGGKPMNLIKPEEERTLKNNVYKKDKNIGGKPMGMFLKIKEEIPENNRNCLNKFCGKPMGMFLKIKEEIPENNRNCLNKFSIENLIGSVKVEKEGTPESDMNNGNNIGGEPAFNLIDYLHEVSHYPKQRILRLCRYHKLNIYERPTPDKVNFVLNELYDREIVDSEKSDTAFSDSDTEEYTFPDASFEQFQPNWENNSTFVVKEPNRREFKLKEPVLNVDKIQVNNPLRPPVNSEGNLPNPIIKPSRFNLRNHQIHVEENIIPAMPRLYLDKQQVKKTAVAEQPLIQGDWSPVDLTGGPEEYRSPHPENVDLDEPGPASVQNQKTRVIDESLVFRLIEIFPEACSEYIRDICDGKKWSDFNDVVTVLLSADNYPKRPQKVPSPVKEVDADEQFEIVKELLPDADPDYLRMQCDKYANNEKGLKEFINQAVEMKDYPTMKEYLRKQQLSAQQKQYTTEFSIEKFIELFPDPAKTFNDPKRAIQMDQMTSHYIVIFFRNKYTKISARIIQQVLVQNLFKPIPSNDKLLTFMESNRNIMKSRRKSAPLPDNLQNIPLLQELAYINHKDEIEKYLIDKQKKEELERLQTKKQGLMQTCQCCFDEEVMPKDTFSCPNGCKFCKDCIQKGCEVAFGQGKLVFRCMADCESEFTLQTLQNVLPPKMFSKVAQKKALEEIKAAGIEDLAMCPFCDFASIPNEADKIFRCLNPDCMKESCRLCKEPNHIPLKCEEVEKDEHVKARTQIEDAMTKALIRTCWKCGTSFFKEEGCNKMTCSCGAQMCYICKQPVNDYTHFNGIGGDKFQLCPLYSDTHSVNQENVMKAAAAAKAQVDPSNLKVDPTADVETHYSNRRKQLPREPHMDMIMVRPPIIHQPLYQRIRHHHHHHQHHRNQHQPPHVGQLFPINPRLELPLPLEQQQQAQQHLHRAQQQMDNQIARILFRRD